MLESTTGVKSVNRALELVEILCKADGGISLNELSEKAGLHKTTVHRLLQSLLEYGYANQDSGTRKYKAGLKIFELSHQLIDKMELRDQARPELKELNRETNETVHLAVLDKGEVVYIDKIEPQRTIRMYSSIGKRAPAHCTGVGKALLAYLPEDELERVTKEKGLKKHTKNTITSISALKEELRKVRERGYAVDNAEHEKEVRCVACPIFSHRDKVVAAVSLSVPSFRVGKEKVKKLAPVVKKYAENISRQMGWHSTTSKT